MWRKEKRREQNFNALISHKWESMMHYHKDMIEYNDYMGDVNSKRYHENMLMVVKSMLDEMGCGDAQV